MITLLSITLLLVTALVGVQMLYVIRLKRTIASLRRQLADADYARYSELSSHGASWPYSGGGMC